MSNEKVRKNETFYVIIIFIKNKRCGNMNSIKFAENIRKFRKARGLSMEELGKKLGKAKSSISAWENDKRTPKIGEIQKIADVLGVTKSQLLGIDDSSKDDYAYEELIRIWFEFIYRKGVKNDVTIAHKTIEIIASICQDDNIEFDIDLFNKAYEINKALHPVPDFNDLRSKAVMKLIDDDK